MQTKLKVTALHNTKGFGLFAALFTVVAVGLLTPEKSVAQTAQEAEMAALYEQAFGKKKPALSQRAHNITPSNTAPPKAVLSKKEPTQVTSKTSKEVSTVRGTPEVEASAPAKKYSSDELALLYSQAFGKTVQQQSKPAYQQVKPSKLDKSSVDDASKDDSASSETQQSSNSLASLYAQAFGGPAPTSAVPSNIMVDFRVNKVEVGELKVFSGSSGMIDQVETKALLASLEEIVKEHVFKRITKQLSKQEKTTFSALTAMGLSTEYNSINLSLDLQMDSSLRKPQILSLIGKKKSSVREENKMTAEEISAFLNMYSTVGFNANNSKADIKVKLEGSVNIDNKVLETTVDIVNDKVSLGRTTITYDKPEKLQRFVVGNISTGSRNFQENLELIGVRGSKEFFMSPELQIRPRANQGFILETDSTVELYINNQLRQRFYLSKGVYSLEDIGLYDGANNIRVKIIDEFGKVTIKTSEQFYDSHLLKPGLSLYSASLGYLSKQQAGSNPHLENKPILSGYYEQGLSKDLTASFDMQLSPNSYLLGGEAISSIELGSLKYSMAVSGGQDKRAGYAARLEFKPNMEKETIKLDTLRSDMMGLDTRIGQFINSVTITEEFRSRHFAQLNQVNVLNEPSKRLRAQLQTQFSFNLNKNWRGSLNLAATSYYDAKNSVSANLSASKRFNNGVNLRIGAKLDSREDFAVNLQISIPLDRQKRSSRRHLELLANSKDRSLSSKASYRAAGQVGRESLAGSVATIRDDQGYNTNLDVNYRDSKYETSLKAYDARSTNGSSQSQRLQVGFNSSIACVGKECATSYPINDSFALVKGPSNQKTPIAVKNGYGSFKYSESSDSDLPENYTSLIPAKGNAVVPLESYRYQNINIDEATLPDGYDSEKTEFEVFPRYHQGFAIKAGGEPATILDGELVDEMKKSLAYKGGQWVPLSKKGKTIAFFSNKAGRFRIASIPAGRYKLELFDYPDMRTINIFVPNKKGAVHDVGALIVR